MQIVDLPRVELGEMPGPLHHSFALDLLAGKIPPDFAPALNNLKGQLWPAFSRSELYQRYGAKLERDAAAGRMSALDTVADALGAREELCALLTLAPEKFNDVLLPDHVKSPQWAGADPDLRNKAALYGLYDLVASADVFLWKYEIAAGAEAMTLPDHVFGREGFQTPLMWWTFDHPLVFKGENLGIVGGILIVASDDRISMFYFFLPPGAGDNRMTWSTLQILFGERISESFPGAWVLKLVAFLNSKYVSSERTRLPRGLRRAMERDGKKKEEIPSVRVVQLRTKIPGPGKSNGSDPDGPFRDWAGRWRVRGHIRAQWCPSTKTHKLIWIAPHLKGPEDKAILGRTYHVVR